MDTQLPSDDITNKKISSSVSRKFENFSQFIDNIIGTPYWFVFSIVLVILWFPTGFFIGFGEIWHLIISTITTILTFLMMSLLHASQSKWEDRMYKLEESQKITLDYLKRETRKIAQLEEKELAATVESRTHKQSKELISSLT